MTGQPPGRPAGPARGQGRGSFVESVLTTVDKFYSEVVQHIKPWAPAPPRIRESEAAAPDELITEDEILAGGGNRSSENPDGVLQANLNGMAEAESL